MDQVNQGLAQWMNAPIFFVGQTPVTLGSLGVAFLIVIGSLFLSSIIQRLILSQLKGKLNISKGMLYAIRKFVHYGCLIVGILIATQTIGLNFGSLAVVFGFISVGIGFGLQNLTSNFIAGLILLIEQPIAVGDYVTIGEQYARVEEIKIRSTMVRTQDNVTIIIPNAQLVENEVTNWSHGDPLVRLHCPVGVAYGSDMNRVKEVLIKVADEHPHILKKPAPEVRFLEFGDPSLNMDVLFWTKDPDQQFKLRSEINFAIDQAFRDAGVQIPFPQRDLHVKPSPVFDQLAEKT